MKWNKLYGGTEEGKGGYFNFYHYFFIGRDRRCIKLVRHSKEGMVDVVLFVYNGYEPEKVEYLAFAKNVEMAKEFAEKWLKDRGIF